MFITGDNFQCVIFRLGRIIYRRYIYDHGSAGAVIRTVIHPECEVSIGVARFVILRCENQLIDIGSRDAIAGFNRSAIEGQITLIGQRSNCNTCQRIAINIGKVKIIRAESTRRVFIRVDGRNIGDIIGWVIRCAIIVNNFRRIISWRDINGHCAGGAVICAVTDCIGEV